MSTQCQLDSAPPVVTNPLAKPWRGLSNGIATVWLVGALLCVGLACTMRVGENRRVYLPGASEPVAELCMLYSRLGIDCPGCGLTRTFIYMAHGQLVLAWQTNPVGILVFLLACVQIVFGSAQVIFRNRSSLVESWGKWNDWCIAALLLALVLQWAIRFVV